jgi:hypothetical protein
MIKNSVFNYLTIYKNFPTYQLERRLDAFMLPYIADSIKDKFNTIEKDLIMLYPEFPLKRDIVSIELDKHSEYADYLLYSKKSNTVYLVEFKTDVKSIHESQFKSYLDNSISGWESMINYYIDKSINNSKFWKKFVYGLIHIEKKAPNLLGINENLNLDKYLIDSKGIHERLKDIRSKIKIDKNLKVKFLYLAPIGAESILKKYKYDNLGSIEHYIGHITLSEFAKNVTTELADLLILIDKDSLKKQ